MVSARTIGMMVTDPQRGHVALHALRKVLALPSGADGIGVATCVDRAVLLSRRPGAVGEASWTQLIGPLKGRTAVVQARAADEVRPPRGEPADLGPWRSKQVACAVSSGFAGPDEANAVREKHLAELPDFLARSVAGRSEGEAFFFATLAKLHASGHLEAPSLAVEPVVAAVRALHERHSPGVARQVTFATGTELVHVAFGFESAVVRIEGLSEALANELDPTLADSAIGRERLRRFRAVLALGRLNEAFEDKRGLPDGAVVLGQPRDAALVVSRDLEIRVV